MSCYKSRGTVRYAPTSVGDEFLERSCNGITKCEGWVKIQWDKGSIFSGILQVSQKVEKRVCDDSCRGCLIINRKLHLNAYGQQNKKFLTNSEDRLIKHK
jgi:hypothetical protein